MQLVIHYIDEHVCASEIKCKESAGMNQCGFKNLTKDLLTRLPYHRERLYMDNVRWARGDYHIVSPVTNVGLAGYENRYLYGQQDVHHRHSMIIAPKT